MHQSHAHRNQFRRLNIAAGIVGGKSLAAIAREEGVSRQTISKQAASNEVQQIVVLAVNSQVERINGVFDRVLAVIEDAFEARLCRVGKDGVAVDLDPDHYALLPAVDRLIKLLTAGRSIPKA